MSQIYANSTVTLAASGSDGVHDGMMTARNLIGFVPCQLVPELHIRDYRMQASSPNFPLNRRAWYLQETVLSSRVIWYGTEELFWSCRKCQRRESLWNEDWSMREDDLSQGVSIFEPEPLLIDFIASSKKNVKLGAWHDIVSMYSVRQLTMQSDKLSALTGIATLFGSIFEDSMDVSTPALTNATVKDGFVAVQDPRFSFYVDPIDEYCVLLRVTDEHCLILTSTVRPLTTTTAIGASATSSSSTARFTTAADFLYGDEAYSHPFDTFLRVGYLAFDRPQSDLSGGSSRLGKHTRMLDELVWNVRRIEII